jgi:hypothetical protein
LLLEASKKAKENDTKAMTTIKDSDEEYGFCVTKEEIVASTNSSGLHDYDILCDNQASISIFHKKNILKNIHNIEESIKVAGVGGRIEVNQVRILPGFGKIYYHPDGIANILSFFDLAIKFKVSYNGVKIYSK